MEKKKNMRKRVQPMIQMEVCECGAVSLAMILAYYGKYVSIEDVRYQCGVTRDGCNAADLLMAAESYGLKAKGYRKTVEGLRDIKLPAIIHWDFVHFVVLEGISGNAAYICDPAIGRRKLSLEELEEGFTGVVLTFEKSDSFAKNGKPQSIGRMIKDRLCIDKRATIFMVLAGILLILPGVLIPILTQSFIDTYVLQKDDTLGEEIIIALSAVYLYKILFTFLKSTVLAKLQLKMALITNHQLMYRMLRLDSNFYEQRSAGELSNRADNNNAVNSFLAGNFSTAMINLFESFFYLILMFTYSRILTLIGLFGVLINVVFTLLVATPLKNLNTGYILAQGKLSAALCTGLSVASTMKANGAEDECAMKMLNSYANTTDSDQRLGRAQQVLGAVPKAVSDFINIIVLMAGGYFIIQGECTTGVLTSFCMLLGSFSSSVNTIISMSQRIQSMRANLERVRDVMYAKTEPRYYIDEKSVINKRLSGAIKIKGLEYGYNPSLPATISNIAFSATPGSRIAIVGSSGCGKSTLGKIIAGIISPWKGEIEYDYPLSQIPQYVLCENLCMINQDSVIFSGSVKDNITIWNNSYTDNELMQAIEDADAENLISKLPGGINYKLEEGGVNLSGGQRQKIQIARALIKKPSILILDEATSALDAVSEQKIMNNIRCRDMTCIVIAHRLSSIKDSDLIIVMDKGMIVESGNHHQLMEKGGHYKRLVES